MAPDLSNAKAVIDHLTRRPPERLDIHGGWISEDERSRSWLPKVLPVVLR